MNFVAAAGDVLAGRAHVVFDIAGTKNAARVDVFKAGDNVETSTMAHAHHEFGGAEARAGIEKFIDQRNQRGHAFEREALAPEIALLHDLLENIRANEQIENALLVFWLRLGLHAFVNPEAALGSVDVVNLDTDGAGVDGAGFAGVLTVNLQFGRDARSEKAERVEVAFEISPLTKGVEYSFAFGGCFNDGGSCAAVGRLGFLGWHISSLLG